MFEKYLTKTGRLSCTQPQEIKNQWYIEKFREVHGDTYDYSNVVYTGQLQKVEIICKQHGSFFQAASGHLSGNGCPHCYGNKKKDTKQCIQDFKRIHGDKYDYSKSQYINCATKVEIICKEHGSFSQRPDDHLKGSGCPSCQGTKKKDTQQCVEGFKRVHGEKYSYSKVKYTNNKEKVEIICKQHGSFFQRPYAHLEGHGCPTCQNHNQNTLYLLKCLDTGLIKIGITNNLRQRISSIGGSLEYLYHITVENPRQLEKSLHQEYKDFQVFNPTVKNGGTEFFQLSESQVLNIIQFLSSI